MVDKIRLISGNCEIEGLLERCSREKGAVITHPHPLYGGDMHNNVVTAITHAYRRQGYTTLKFNFRGVGSSQGSHDNGIGEQKDVGAAISYLIDLGITHIDLAGYSFGAWVNALASQNEAKPQNMVMISPPVAFIDFGTIFDLGCLRLIVTGSRDEIAPVKMIKKSRTTWNEGAQFEIIDGADHFYMGYLDKLEAILTDYIEGKT